MLADGQTVTIKKCNAVDETNIQDFIDKIITLSQIDHRNTVRLLCCCLETLVPILVYEFFELKTLDDYILDDSLARHLSWDIRLMIASETAGVLAYMHSDIGGQIIHGGLNSSIIVLHNGYIVKMREFDLNLLSSLSGYGVHWLGYSDPEDDSSGITVKSDVYSLGVILAEILTGQKAYSDDRLEGEEHLAQYFVNRRDNLLMILDPSLGTDGRIVQLTEVGKLAKRCLSYSREERPTMKEVVTALQSATNRNSGSTTICPNPSQERTARRAARRNRSF